MLALFEFLERFITHTVADYGYVAVFLMMAVGSACVPIPSEVVLVYGGALASSGFAAPGKELDFVLVALLAVAGAMAGSWFSWGIGYVGGRPLIDRWGKYLLLRPHEVDRAHEWFERKGEAAVFFTRLIPIVRAFVSLPAGVARMRFWRFTLYTLLGNLLWCFGLAYLGLLLGARWHIIQRYFDPLVIVCGLLLAGLIAWFVMKRLRARRAEQAAVVPERPGESSGG